jgi:glycosyltransferase involved in cell wall biosynthesis
MQRVNCPILSVVVPSFNQGRYLPQNLEELFKMRPLGVEVIVMDGGSTDSTRDYLQRNADRIDFCVSEKDDGQAAAINAGLSRANGDWLAFQNSDDYFVEGALSQVLPILERTDADLIVGGTRFIDEHGSIIHEAKAKPIFRTIFSVKNFLHNQALFVRASFARKVGFLDPSLQFCLDYDWFIRLLEPRPKIQYLRYVIGVQRIHGDTKTARLQDIHAREFKLVRDRYFRWPEVAMAQAILPSYRAYRFVHGLVG